MRQRSWLELTENYDCTINYHLRKANVVTDALNKNIARAAEKIKVAQNNDTELIKKVWDDQEKEFNISEDGALRFRAKLCVPVDNEIRRTVLEKAHKSMYTVHPSSTKMCQDLRETFWWNGMKRVIAEFVQ
ncbi:uncharacterized protein LOC131156017 [Malania oleifera]|uniref:uncharacterized protein LOC131156017 n=1 Tax=Malania oleifera TaxID=397392 RepID=UPI0025AE955D|nr:uncharacterized protein LOC131156017 [Malania oleifera]